MKNSTKFMEVMFSAVENNDEELALQVSEDIEKAKAEGSLDTDEIRYDSVGDGKVAITDKVNNEVTMAELAEEGTYDLYPAQVDEQLEGFLHPEMDGVTPGAQVGVQMEDVSEDHLNGVPVSDAVSADVEEIPMEDERQFSISTDNAVVLKIFSDQEFCERLFSEVIESEQTSVVGDLKIEKDPESEDTVIVTSGTTGDQVKVTLGDEEMEVTELESKNFCGVEGMEYLPMYVVGVDPVNHVIVEAPVYDEQEGADLANDLAEKGVEGLQIFESPEEVRDYAFNLMSSLGVETVEDIEEPVQVEYSETNPLYLTKFYSSRNNYMQKLFSEEADQEVIEDAIESGEEIENDSEIVTPVDDSTAVVEDKETGEFTKVVLDGEDMEVFPITEEEAEKLCEGLVVGEDEVEEKEFSNIYTNEEETRFFSENEYFTNYMERLFSEEADQEVIEDAIESGEEIENDSEIVTPVDDSTAVVEDKETGEFTKVVLDNEDMEVFPITEEEAEKLCEGLVVGEDEEVEEKEFSNIYTNEEETRFFSENEYFTNYMERLFSEEADQEVIEDAIESGEEIENDSEIVTPVDDSTAVVEDKETGEFTKVVLDGEDMEVFPITEEEAEKLCEGLVVGEDEEVEEKEEEKSFTGCLGKFFSEEVGQGVQPEESAEEEKPSVEAIEDKALAAIQSIQGVAEEATQAIMEAKEAPIEAPEDLKEAQFSESEEVNLSPLENWLGNVR